MYIANWQKQCYWLLPRLFFWNVRGQSVPSRGDYLDCSWNSPRLSRRLQALYKSVYVYVNVCAYVLDGEVKVGLLAPVFKLKCTAHSQHHTYCASSTRTRQQMELVTGKTELCRRLCALTRKLESPKASPREIEKLNKLHTADKITSLRSTT